MSTRHADENLLFGILAVQMDFIDRNALVAAMNHWVLHKDLSLGQILVQQEALSAQRHELLSALVDEHLQQHDNDPQKSLASISAAASVKSELERMGDDDVQASLACVPSAGDSFQASATLSVGASSSSGERFRILRPYAKGGLGEVSIAQDIELHRDVALKEIQPQFADNDESRTRFVLEAEITGALEHPGIVPVYGLGKYGDGRPYYAMRFIRGDSLHDAIKRFHSTDNAKRNSTESALELRKLLGRFVDVCNAIEYAHSRGVLHRDLKPGNVMLGKYGETLVVDWGLAKVLDRDEEEPKSEERPVQPQSGHGSAATQMGKAIGTPAYMAPEQASGRLDELGRESDVYSLGATLYQLLTGRPPFEDKDIGVVLRRVQNAEFENPREVDARIPKALESICLKAMALMPADRYASPAALAEDIEHWMADEPVSAHAEPLTQRTARWMRRHRSWTVAGAAALVLVAVVSIAAIVIVSRAKQQESQAWELTAKTRLFDIELLEPGEFDEARLRELETLLDEIASLSMEDFQVRRTRLHQAYADQLQGSLDVARFTDEDRERFDARVAVLEARRASANTIDELVVQLKAARDARLTRWDTIFELDDALSEALPTVFESAAVQTDDGASLRRADEGDAAYERVATTVACPPGNIEFKAVFDRTWTRSSVVGISFNVSDDHAYDFLLAVPQFFYRDATEEELEELPSFDEVFSRRNGGQLTMYIMRDGQPLRMTPAHVSQGRLRLLARREGGTLILTVNDANTIKFEDPFPLSVKQPGQFGIYWPRDVYVESLEALRLRTPSEPSPIELGDELYAAGEYSDALKAFAEIGGIEATYKAALCQFELGEVQKFEQVMAELGEEPPSGESDPDDRWRLRAACRLLQYRVEERQWQDVRDLLGELSQFYSRDTIALLIPATQHELIFQYFRRPGNRSQFFGDKTNAVEDLKWALLVEELFNEDAASRRVTRWRLADAHRWNKENGEATKIVRDLLDDKSEGIPAFERMALVTDLVDLLSAEGYLDDARRAINRWLVKQDGSYNREFLPLLSLRAATWVNAGDTAQAAADLEYFLTNVGVHEIDYAHYAHACGLRGLLHQDAGEMNAAEAAWRKGLRRNWHEPAPDFSRMSDLRGYQAALAYNAIVFNLTLGAWTNEITQEEAYGEIWGFYPGNGVFSTSFRKLIEVTLEPPLVHAVILAANRAERGRERGRQNFLRSSSTGDSLGPLVEFVRLSCMTNLDFTPAIEDLLIDQCQKALDLFFVGHFSETNVKDFLNLWRGRFSKTSMNRLAKKVDEQDAELMSSAAFVVANKYYMEDNLAVAQYGFEWVLARPNVHPIIETLTRQQLAKLTSGQPGKPKPMPNIQ